MADPPAALRRILDGLAGAERETRIELLLAWADRYRKPPRSVATPPYPAGHRVPGCESEAYVWAVPRRDGTLDFHVAVENPLGVSVRALAAILVEAASGAALDEVLAIDESVVTSLFGAGVSMGRGQGLAGMVAMVKAFARLHAAGR